VPTLVLHGADDFVPIEVAAHVAQAIPAARLAVVPQCGHFAYLEAPDAVVQQVRELFASQPSAPRPDSDFWVSWNTTFPNSGREASVREPVPSRPPHASPGL